MTPTAPRAPRLPRLLLLAALLLGIAGMHALGHPAESRALPAPGTFAAATFHDAERVAHVAGSGVTATSHGAGHGGPGGTGTDTGMDPGSVCLAVLAGLGVLVLGGRLRGTPRRRGGGGGRRAGRTDGGGRHAPPPQRVRAGSVVLRV
ncbi:hypothetical protein LG634_35170 [Streptomyces bambusae]|uniref:hypothetical protein n=1 Tax=Streptomyces bambusae TaxID=1550616 RepID=UPI001CFF5624|nr:hypothetical protein [Streptomyces bambusae]MCB5170032.1 hypothetical protein [Streptomyces bambusae]